MTASDDELDLDLIDEDIGLQEAPKSNGINLRSLLANPAVMEAIKSSKAPKRILIVKPLSRTRPGQSLLIKNQKAEIDDDEAKMKTLESAVNAAKTNLERLSAEKRLAEEAFDKAKRELAMFKAEKKNPIVTSVVSLVDTPNDPQIEFEKEPPEKRTKKNPETTEEAPFEDTSKTRVEQLGIRKGENDGFHYCEKCPFKARRRQKVKRHFKSQHARVYDQLCDQCDFRHHKFYALQKHKLRIHGLMIKNPSEDRQANLIREPEKYKCTKCEFKTHAKWIFQNHFNTVHLKKKSIGYDTSGQGPLIRPYFKCEECDFVGRSQNILENHKRVKHQNLAPLDTSGKEKIPCHYEGCNFFWVNTLRSKAQHIREAHDGDYEYEPIKCPECDYTTDRNEEYLERHMTKKHGGESKNELHCDICPRRFFSKVGLSVHRARHVVVEKNQKCRLCDFSCALPAHLTYHVRCKHLGKTIGAEEFIEECLKNEEEHKRHKQEEKLKNRKRVTITSDVQ